jgi:hypothetical protein
MEILSPDTDERNATPCLKDVSNFPAIRVAVIDFDLIASPSA